jgi:hypothetical protein
MPAPHSPYGHYGDSDLAAEQGQPVPGAIRSRVEAVTGVDLSQIQAHTGQMASQMAAAHHASAFALGTGIYFQTEQYRPGTPDGDWLIAHELAHSAQQQGAASPSLQAKLEVGPAYDDAEVEADRIADGALQGQTRLPGLTRISTPRIQRFAPDGHRKAGAAGLKGSFSAEEIGLIYQSNWERDFSQGPAKIADAVIAWKLVKESATQNQGTPDEGLARQFQDKAWAILDMNLDALDESMGGYQPWEHMDHPGKKAAGKAEKRRQGQAREMSAYLEENRAHVMNLMVQAVELYWQAQGRPQHGISNWRYDAGLASTTPPKKAAEPTLSRGVIGRESTEYAKSIGARSEPLAQDKDGKPLMTQSADPLGRAMHCIEDFFSHSNWLELARRVRSGETIQGDELQSSTFGLPDKCHALGHKLLALADALLSDFDLLLRVFGRSTEHQPNWIQAKALDIDLAPMGWDSRTPLGEILDLYTSSSALEADVRAGFLSLESILCNRSVLQKIRSKGMILIEEGEKEAPEGGHGKRAKDQPEPGKDFASAHGLATKANELIIAPLKAAMEAPDSDQGARMLAVQLSVACQVLAPPSASHPLMGLIR